MERWIEWLQSYPVDRKTIERIAVILVCITAILFYSFQGESKKITVEGTAQTQTKTEKEESVRENTGSIYVDVGGCVRAPGVYECKNGDRVFQVIKKAGGLTKSADTSALNQAEKVKDGQKVFVPKKNAENAGTGTPAGASLQGVEVGGNKVNINQADSATLQTLTGVGPATAEKIIAYRNEHGRFESVEDLMKVSGIGEKTFQKLRDSITV